jgi:hypothetical protein
MSGCDPDRPLLPPGPASHVWQALQWMQLQCQEITLLSEAKAVVGRCMPS